MIELRHKITDDVLYSGNHDSVKEAVVAASKRGAHLRWADLRGAKIKDGYRIYKIPLQVDTARYSVLIFDSHMQIGCEFHKLVDWWAFDDRRIIKMDGKTALEWWVKWKPLLQQICVTEGRGESGGV